VQVDRAVRIHIAMASSSFQWMSPLKNGQANMQTMTRHARTGNKARNGNSVHFAACALSKISANPKLWTRNRAMVPSHGCLVRLQSQTCFSHLFDLSRVCECCACFHNLPLPPPCEPSTDARVLINTAAAAHVPSRPDPSQSPPSSVHPVSQPEHLTPYVPHPSRHFY
jgi:hypothetical protein